jgi:hypothetical protein
VEVENEGFPKKPSMQALTILSKVNIMTGGISQDKHDLNHLQQTWTASNLGAWLSLHSLCRQLILHSTLGERSGMSGSSDSESKSTKKRRQIYYHTWAEHCLNPAGAGNITWKAVLKHETKRTDGIKARKANRSVNQGLVLSVIQKQRRIWGKGCAQVVHTIYHRFMVNFKDVFKISYFSQLTCQRPNAN